MDPFDRNLAFNRNNLFSEPTDRELGQGRYAGRNPTVFVGNVLDPNFTDFPQVIIIYISTYRPLNVNQIINV